MAETPHTNMHQRRFDELLTKLKEAEFIRSFSFKDTGEPELVWFNEHFETINQFKDFILELEKFLDLKPREKACLVGLISEASHKIEE